ncbi:MAG TPA: efflux RND transporter periplasmic adaptor subunit [Xanthobacteraceae bacterium]|jgi:multidrug efflux system membrane fusion protein|nr:efflux RND transporter periplasmic adaptor subunit [Xanthobacteraceae bacterium]
MSRSKALLGLFIVAAAGGAAASGKLGSTEELAKWLPPLKWFAGGKAEAQSGQVSPTQRAVAVEVGRAIKKKTPVILEALGNVTTIASVAVKPRLDDEIVGIHFVDGAFVKKGDLLVTLDTRAIEAQIAQAEGNLARDQAQLEGAERDFRRYTELVPKGATPVLNLENAQTQVDTFRAAIRADLAALENLKVQLSYCNIRAPISGRISQAAVKVGNFVRSADTIPIATINQIAPIYVTFTVPQRNLPELRVALAETGAAVEAIIPGDKRRAHGTIAMIENAIDPTTGMATVRANMPNEDELLWPGTLVSVQVTLRTEEAVAVPSTAVQVSQQGTFVYVVKDNVATVTPVKVSRLLGNESVIEQGLDDGDVVVTDGHLLLTNGARVTVRERKAGA